MAAAEWQWDEMLLPGADFHRYEEVEIYDTRMAEVRDVAAENRAILDALKLGPTETVLEVGTGTGAFARAAARVCRRVIAIDVSKVMLEYASRRASAEELMNVEFVHAGFLTYEHEGEPVDAVVSCLALHHVPDFWKAFALRRVRDWLRPGGRLYLQDAVFDSQIEDYGAYFEGLAGEMSEAVREPFVRHVAREYSTLDWILEGLVRRAGFEIVSMGMEKGFMAQYLCVKGSG